MNRFFAFIILTISLFGITDLCAQNIEIGKTFVSNRTIKQAQARLISRTKQSELQQVLSKSTENNSNSRSKVAETSDSSIVRLISGTQWFMTKQPQKPLFFRFRLLINSTNYKLADYYRFVAFCYYFKKNGDLNYDEIDYISMNKEYVSDNGERFSINYKISFSSNGKPIVY